MKIAVYTLTRDRLEMTKLSFQSLRDKAGFPFDHYVIDNGSEDGTVEWLKSVQQEPSYAFKQVIFNSENKGISVASNQALEAIFSSGEQYDLIIKFDNDCLILSENILGQVKEIYESIGEFAPGYILSPYVSGINNQPTRGGYTQLAGRRVGLTAIVGGIFHIVPADIYKKYRYDESLAKAHGQDDQFCAWVKGNCGQCGYIEGLRVEHMWGTDEQANRYPEYFARKHDEEVK